ncbi:Protein unc-80 [Caenorhabditis elegans]|uniref:Isoform c of Protein unc-80 n=1 Tax=Caenorhabditis elegans TaxID=6239 RepID=Q9XV66-3|nr:Protein unc-80 [Caenorhabditis elegans]CAR64667.2 Protein unc-80 [Caenorhabditis elegans]|eukprot:NP_001129895.2 Protein unc-80 [Caenorhabditis elegans]
MPLSTAASFKSAKWTEEEGEEECDSVPLPIQTFLWRQTNPFLGDKIGKLHEASCVTFERVVVQNILHGLSPSLSNALASVSRWKLVRAALPHVIQCCGSLLLANVGEKKLPTSLQKILYILHWMLIDSSSECIENASTKDDRSVCQSRTQGLFNISSIQLFIYLIAPLADVISEEEVVDNIRLESGLKVWQAIWQFRQPDVWCFSAPVKQRRDELPQITFARRQNPAQLDTQGIYLGKDENTVRRPSIVPPPKPPRTDVTVLNEKRKLEEEKMKMKEDYVAIEIEAPSLKPNDLLIDMSQGVRNKEFERTSSIVRSVSEYKTNLCGQKEKLATVSKSRTSDAFDSSPTSDSSANMLEEVEGIKFSENENCSLSAVFFSSDQAPLVNLSDICSGFSIEEPHDSTQSSVEVPQHPVLESSMFLSTTSSASDVPPFVLTRASTAEDTTSSCSQQTVIPLAMPVTTETTTLPVTLPKSALTKTTNENRRTDHQRMPSTQKSVSGSTDDELDEGSFSDPTIASYLDVAVIRALLITHWQEKGVYWALSYIHNRLIEIKAYMIIRKSTRQRSNSLPSGERKLSVAPEQLTNPVWDDLKIENKPEEGRSHLHVAFNDTERRKSSDNCLAPHPTTNSRRSSLNTLSRRGINRSNPSLSNSVEVLSIRDDAEDDVSNISSKSIEKENTKLNAVFYPEALGSTNFIEKDGKISATVIVQTVNQVMDRCTGVRQCELALNIADVLLGTPLEQTETFFVQLNIMVFKIYLCLGCPHGCNEGVKSPHGDFLRAKAKAILAGLERVQPDKFKNILNDYVDNYGTQQVIDLLHSITSFCRSELTALDGRRASESRVPSYRNTFNEKDKGIEGRIINATYKTLITKISVISAELSLPENMSLQQDVRLLVNFVQEHHGNPFRRVGLSALKDATCKNPTTSDFHTKEDQTGGSPGAQSQKQSNDQASLRRGLFKKKNEKSGGTTTGNDDSEGDSSPSTPRTVSSMDDGVSPLASTSYYKKKSAPKLHFAFGLLKSVKPDMDEEISDNENEEGTSNEEAGLPQRRPLRQSSKQVKARLPIDSKGGMRLWGTYVPPPNYIDAKGIFDGARRFAFLLETARPGTFPDAPLIAAIMHLKSPVLARASLLLECANLVSRCNRGQWPEWIRSSHHRTFSLGGALANRGTPSATRRMHSLQRQAGRYFYQWGVQIGEHISKLLELSENKSKKTLQMEDTIEDFFDDGIVNNQNGEKCPIALQFIAVLLLQEITAFLRETFKTIPRSKNSKPQTGNSGWDKLLSHRRWSILSNTFNAQQTGSVNSITEINSSIHLNDKERRISFSATEEDSPRGSKDAIDEINAVDKKGSIHMQVVRPPSLSARLFSRQSTHEESGGSAQGSTKSTTYVPETGRRIATGRQRLLKRGSPMATGTQPSLESSHKRKSFRNRKQSKQAHLEEEEKSDGAGATHILSARESLKPTDDGLQSPVESVHPVIIPHSNHGSAHSQQPVVLKSSMDDEEQHMLSNLPWIKVLIKFSNSFDLECNHVGVCSAKCFQRVHRQCFRMIESLSTLYGMERNVSTRADKRNLLADNWQAKQQALRKQTETNSARASIHARQSTAVPRRESAMVGQPEFASKAIKMMLMEKMQQEKEKEKEKEKEEKDALKKQSVEQDHSSTDTEEDAQLPEKNKPMLTYLRSLVLQLVHSPISSVLKCCLLLSVEQHKQMIEVCWKMLIHEDPHVVASAASMFIVASVKKSEESLLIIKTALDSQDPQVRTSGIQRFYTLWRNRFHAWLKMEDGAQASFKVPPPGIDFTLPSPAIGQSQLPVVDPPWMPHLKTKIEELSLKEEEHATSQTIMTMTRTRRKQKQEMVKRAVREAEERQSEQRQLFRLRSSAIVSLAAYEPALFHHQQEQTEESDNSHQHARHVMPVAQPLFPSALLSVVPQIIELLDDPQVDNNGVSVGDVAKKVIWTCIVEDPSLFLRHFLEKLTNRDRQEALMSQLRKLVLRFHPLPSQAAHSLLNYLFGFVMHYVRAQCEGSEKAIGMALSICWLLSPNIHGLYFKDLKQTLKKEQCDQALMITANVPSAKKIIVHGLDSTSGGIPSQFPVHEDTQFHQILNDSLEFFNIDEDDLNCFYLTDTKTGVIHLPAAYVRDYYFFHRSFYPQLTLVKLSPEVAEKKMKETAFHQKFIECGKVLLTHNILKYSPQHVIAQRVFFLHDEFTHLPSFPRKSLETCFGMYFGPGGEQLKAMESMHKFVWAKMMSDMFEKMENAFMFADLHLFINVINGIMIMHCEDVLILRRCAATYISISIHFNTLFASQGFFLIMPTLLRCYSQRQTNKVFCGVVEFICRQFYTLHRKPFLLQMCGAIANIIDNSSNDFEINPMRVKAKYWFNLIKKMEEITDEDPLDILGLVPYEKPLKALDLCYRDDPNTFCALTDAMASCICVCAFSPESKRSHHMLLIMQAMLPHMMKRLEEETLQSGNSPAAVKHEISQWITMAVEMKALINSCEQLVRGPTRAFDLVNSVSERGKSFVADSPQFFDPPTTNEDENSRPYHLKEKRSTAVAWEAAEVEEQQKETYRRPRDTLLQLIAAYIEMASVRLKELTKLGANLEHAKIPDVLDHKCYVKLGEVALALLKVAPYDLSTTTCHGLQKYFQIILPVTDWSIESNRSALNIILRRLDKTLSKIAKRQSFRKRAIWIALSSWINGICDTLNAFPYIAHLHPLRTITQLCLRMMVGDPCVEDSAASTALHPTTVLHPTPPPQTFANAVLRLTTILMQALGQFAFSLDFVTSTEGMGVSSERLEAVLCHVLIPLFLRIPNNPKEQSIFQAKDLSQCLTVMQNAISPPLVKQQAPPLISTSTLTTTFIRGAQDVTGRQGSVSVTDRGHSATVSTHRIVRESICQAIYLGLKVLMLTFGKLLAPMWPRVARIVKDLLAKKPGAPTSMAFVDFLLHSNLPISLFILPMIQNKMKQKPGTDQEAAWQTEILEKLDAKSHNIVPPSILLVKCYQELQQLKEELTMKPIEMTRSYTPTMADPHSDSSAASTAPRGASSRQSIDRRTSVHMKKVLPTMKEDIPEDPEDSEDVIDSNSTGQVTSRISKSPSIPLNKTHQSSRTRSVSGFGMWRSVRRKSRHVSSAEESSEERGSVELHDVGHHSALHEPNRTPNRRSTEALVLPLHESIDTNRHRFVSFSTPKKTHEVSEDVFQITEQHQLV